MADDAVQMEVVDEDSQSRNIPSDTETTSSQISNQNEGSSESRTEKQVHTGTENVIICDSCKNGNKNNLNTNKRPYPDEDEDDGSHCPICFDVWTNSGEHRLCAVRCGHLFGHSCLVRWLQGQRTCPTCKSSVRKVDIRFIYARKLVAYDTTELNCLKKQLEDTRAEKQQLEMDRLRDTFEVSVLKEEVASLKKKLKSSMGSGGSVGETSRSLPESDRKIMVYKEGELKFGRDGGCRVMAYNKFNHSLAISIMSSNTLFSGFGIKKINAKDLKLLSYTSVHSKPIRDLSYHPDRPGWLLSVSLDKSARLLDDTSRQPVLNIVGEHPLWSCCWDTLNQNCFYVGMANGSVCKHDIRKTDVPVMASLAVPNDLSPVVSLANTAAGLLVCKLCSCWIVDNWPDAEQDASGSLPGERLPIEGPFVSMCYEPLSDNVLVSCRPNQSHFFSRHIACKLERSVNSEVSCKISQVFHGAPTQKMMARSCLMNIGDGEVLAAASQEAERSVNIWSVTTKKEVGVVASYEPAMDLCHVPIDNQHNFAVLNEIKLSMYKFERS